MEQVTATEIARVLNVPIHMVRTWDGYDSITDTVELNEAELAGLWNVANGHGTIRYERSRESHVDPSNKHRLAGRELVTLWS